MHEQSSASHGAEVWRPVLGFEGRYEVSSIGRVRRSRGGRGHRGSAPDLLTVRMAPTGYPLVHFGGRTRLVHSLVLEAFVGPRPPGYQCAHENGVRYDNRVENLSWKTVRDNALDKWRHGTMLRVRSVEVVVDEAVAAAELDRYRDELTVRLLEQT